MNRAKKADRLLEFYVRRNHHETIVGFPRGLKLNTLMTSEMLNTRYAMNIFDFMLSLCNSFFELCYKNPFVF